MTFDENGLVKGVHGFGDAAEKLIKQFQQDSARKGRKVEVGVATSESSPLLSLGLNGDFKIINKEIRKIAYLMSVRVFDDDAIRSRSGEIYRGAIYAESEDQIRAIGLGGGTNIDIIPTLTRIRPNEHALTCFRMGDTIISAVILFGLITGFCITPADGFSAAELEGEVVIIDARTSALTCSSYDKWPLEYMQTQEFAQAMAKAARMQT